MLYDLIIVGGGPAGLTAAMYARQKQLNALLVSQELGGKTNYDLELPDVETHHIIRGTELVEKFWRELEDSGFGHKLERITAVSKTYDTFTLTTTSDAHLKAKSVIWATGSRIRLLNVPGEHDFMGKGVSYSAVSHASLFRGKTVAIIGDAKLALQSVAELAITAEMVHFIVPAPTYGVMDTPLLQRLVNSGKVAVWEGYKINAIAGDEYANCVLLETHEGKPLHIHTNGIFIELGLSPNSEAVSALAELNPEGFVLIDNCNRTTCPGLFAAGDVTNTYAEQVLIAIGEGAKAALSAYEYLLPNI